MPTVYLNGEYLPKRDARVSVEDRGFVLADGLYEVTPAYSGKFFRMEQHLARLESGLSALRIEWDIQLAQEIHERLLAANELSGAEVATIYLQITRGVAKRRHAFPDASTPPTVYAFADEFVRPSSERWSKGYSAITVPDRRWARADIKSIALLPNVLAQQAAVDAGVDEALFVKDGVAIEGSHANAFAVFSGVVTTHPASHEILHGISRRFVLELARGLGMPVEERAITAEEILDADEIFFTGTTTEVRPIVELDGRSVGDGGVGPVTEALYQAFVEGALTGR